MNVFNATRNTWLAHGVRIARTMKEKTMGLLHETEPGALFFRARSGVHTFGMKFPIDVIILNKNNVIMRMKTDMQPNRLFFWNPRYRNVLELPAGTIQGTDTAKGDQLAISERKK